ncbi:MAG: hypothetical protein ABFD20_12740 [Anaerolineales bacterium]
MDAFVWRDWLDLFVGVAQMLAAIAATGAFVVTYKTLAEMRKQTEFANDPVLKVRTDLISKVPDPAPTASVSFDYLDNTPLKSWQTIIHHTLEKDLTGIDDLFLVLKLTNVGRSEISSVSITVEMDVSMFESDETDYVKPQHYRFDLRDVTVDLGERDSILLPVVNTRYFPKYSWALTAVKYRDIRGKQYTNYDGTALSLSQQRCNELLKPLDKHVDCEEGS